MGSRLDRAGEHVAPGATLDGDAVPTTHGQPGRPSSMCTPCPMRSTQKPDAIPTLSGPAAARVRRHTQALVARPPILRVGRGGKSLVAAQGMLITPRSRAGGKPRHPPAIPNPMFQSVQASAISIALVGRAHSRAGSHPEPDPGPDCSGAACRERRSPGIADVLPRQVEDAGNRLQVIGTRSHSRIVRKCARSRRSRGAGRGATRPPGRPSR